MIPTVKMEWNRTNCVDYSNNSNIQFNDIKLDNGDRLYTDDKSLLHGREEINCYCLGHQNFQFIILWC